MKICGIRSLEDARFAVESGADALGFVFWHMSPRCVDAALAAPIAAELPASVLRVGVFVDAPREEIERTTDEVGLDVLQLHGEEPPETLAGLPRPVLKAVRVGQQFAAEEALRYTATAGGILVDTRLPGETRSGRNRRPLRLVAGGRPGAARAVPDAGRRSVAGERRARPCAPCARTPSTCRAASSACRGGRIPRR